MLREEGRLGAARAEAKAALAAALTEKVRCLQQERQLGQGKEGAKIAGYLMPPPLPLIVPDCLPTVLLLCTLSPRSCAVRMSRSRAWSWS